MQNKQFITRATAKKLWLGALLIMVLCTVAIATTPKPTLIIDGFNNKAYGEAINSIWIDGLDKTSRTIVELANAHINNIDPKTIVLINPSPKNVDDFYQLAVAHNAKLIIASSKETLKSALFDQGFSKKQVQFDNKTNWDPDEYENLRKGYSY